MQTSRLHTFEGWSWQSKIQIPKLAFGPGDCGRLVACCVLLSDSPFPLDESNPKRGASDGGHIVRSPVGIPRWTGINALSWLPRKTAQGIMYWDIAMTVETIDKIWWVSLDVKELPQSLRPVFEHLSKSTPWISSSGSSFEEFELCGASYARSFSANRRGVALRKSTGSEIYLHWHWNMYH